MSPSPAIPPPSARHLPEEWLHIAPLRLPNHRRERYMGDDLCISMAALAEHDRTLLRDLYEMLHTLLSTLVDTTTSDTEKWAGTAAWVKQHGLNSLTAQVRLLGAASYKHNPDELLAKAMHDLRGGALSALLGRLQMLERIPHTEEALNTLFVLTRDQLKIMRNAVCDLDAPRRQADLQPKAHFMRLIVEKWHRSVVGPQTRARPVRMQVDCRYDGALTECCVESGALDRIFYNLANNAARHAAGDQVEMVIFPLPDGGGRTLRFILSNDVAEEDAGFLGGLGQVTSDARPETISLPALFAPATSSTGSGFGLTLVADFVTHAFGLSSREEALRRCYVGAELAGHTYRVWFHWPTANDTPSTRMEDDFHRPDESLSTLPP